MQLTSNISRRLAILLCATLIAFVLALPAIPAQADQIDIAGPTGSAEFGESVTVLPNGNFVVIDSGYDEGAINDVGAVYLYDGADLSLISTLKGSSAGDQVGGEFRITVLSNGNYVVHSPRWDNGPIADAGAVTFCSGTSGCSGVVAASNSLVGSTADDKVGDSFITILDNGNYVVRSPDWDRGPTADAGAATWCSGTSGCSGAVSAGNSLVGSSADDEVGSLITVLSNSNYAVSSPDWDNGQTADAGAATWCDGTSGCSGEVSADNSLVGTTASDRVGGQFAVTDLDDGNYVVLSRFWDNPNGPVADAGAVTWCSGTSGCAGPVTATNSLVGSTADDQIGNNGIIVLSNGNYVVHSRQWDNGAITDAGAATWCDGTSGCLGEVSSGNSLVGTTADDGALIGDYGPYIRALKNGNYVVVTMAWDNPSGPVVDAGAATWCSGVGGCRGEISSSNSLVGSTTNDRIGYFFAFTALSDGNYVVQSSQWDNGAAENAGAVTWCDGTSGCVGAVNSGNSLVGSSADDNVGDITVLGNGNYVVRSPGWDNGPTADAGAVTWCSAAGGCSGTVNSGNSLVGSSAEDRVGDITVLGNGNYVVNAVRWDNPAGPITDVGAVTWCDGTSGCRGAVNTTNSLVGSVADDQVGGFRYITVLGNSNYVVNSPWWDNGAITDAGASTWCDGASGCRGEVSTSNSLFGSSINDNVGRGGSTIALTNGNYVVGSFLWDDGPIEDVGAATWCDGASGCTPGAVSSGNSLLGSTADDSIGGGTVAALSNGNYVLSDGYWDNGPVRDAGAVVYGDGAIGTRGTISSEIGVLGTVTSGISNFAYDAVNDQLVVGRGASNIVTVFSPPGEIEVQGNGQTIVNGDSTPDAADHTDFGNASVIGDGVVRTFTINNTGLGTLKLGGPPAVTVTESTHFTVDQPASTTIASRTATTFTVRFNPSEVGLHSATLAIASDDSDENPYTFAIQGTGVDQVPDAVRVFLPFISQ